MYRPGDRNPRAASHEQSARDIHPNIGNSFVANSLWRCYHVTIIKVGRLLFTYPDAVHRADLGAHGHDKRPVAAERTASTFVEFRGQRAHEARETAVRVQTYIHRHKAS